jgi:P27 family predicted phage terminase small subunit
MGRRGPARTPTKILEQRGSWRAKDREGEPDFTPSVPECPAFLDEVARAEWVRIVPELERQGLITLVDVAALAGYCQCMSRWQAAEKLIQAEGLTIEGSHGGTVENPAVKIARESMQLMRQFASEFGLTPASRSRVIVSGSKDKEKDGKAGFFTPKLAGGA